MTMIDTHDISRLHSRLESAVSGIVDSSTHYTKYYSVDASSYVIKPDVIVVPRDENDVASSIMIAAEMKSSITPRGGGTGLVGGALNCGIILDMQNLSDAHIKSDSATVGAGITKGRLDHLLAGCNLPASLTKKVFAPNPSVGPFCTIGGMIANNAAGSQSFKHGCTIDNVNSITMIDGNGNTIKLPDDAEVGSKVLEIAKMIDKDKFPKVSKNASGYRLDAVNGILDTHKALVGSEGTLGVITSAELRIIEKPTSRYLYILEYTSIADAAADCMRIAAMALAAGERSPAAVEFVDRTILDNMDCGFDDHVRYLLFVEYEGNLTRKPNDNCIDDGIASHAGDEKKHSGRGNAAVAVDAANVTCVTEDAEITKWWRYRDASLHYSLKSIKNDVEERVPHVIEDAAVPIKSLPALFAALEEINQRYDTRTITYGHAGNGNIHVRLVCQKNSTKNILPKIAAEYFAKILALNGSITGEHGDGLARSEFVTVQYGQKNTRQFRLLKQLFDQSNVMNPGKIIAANSTGLLVQNLSDGTY